MVTQASGCLSHNTSDSFGFMETKIRGKGKAQEGREDVDLLGRIPEEVIMSIWYGKKKQEDSLIRG